MTFTDKQIDNLANRIACDLFTNGNGDHAARLVLESLRLTNAPASELGGWTESAAASSIKKTITNFVRKARK